VDEAVLTLLHLLVSGLVFAYWLNLYYFYGFRQSPNTALIRDICFLLDSPNGTVVNSDYYLDGCIANSMIVSRVPVSSMCLIRINATAVRGPFSGEVACSVGKVRLRLEKSNGIVVIKSNRE